ncbi:hypothetical protein M8J77_002910 [Diaphorina citri]|nr:hypothetical protein M8J77_002910 [Diaphorina citri]
MDKHWDYIFLPLKIDDLDQDLELIGTKDLTKDFLQECFTGSTSDCEFNQKIVKLCETWSAYNKILKELDNNHFHQSKTLFQFILKYSLQNILDAKWAELSTEKQAALKENIQTCHHILEQKNWPEALYLSNVLRVVEEPWPPIVVEIFDDKGTPSEIQEYYKYEEGDIFIERIRMLCSECEDLAYKLVKKCYPLSNQQDRTVLHDVRLILMVRQDNLDTLTTELNLLKPSDGVDFVKRLIGYEKLSKVCTYMSNVHAQIGSVLLQAIHLIMVNFMGQPQVDSNYQELCVIWVDKIFTGNKSFKLIQSLGDMSNSSDHLFILTEEIMKKFADIDLPFCIELFTRATTININEFSSTKISKEEKQKLSEVLCKRFLRLAELFHSCHGIRKECILTAFTLYPTQELLKQIVKLCGFLPSSNTVIKQEIISDDENEQTAMDVDYSDNINDQCDDIIYVQSTRPLDALNNDPKGKILTDSINYDCLEAPNIISRDGEQLGLSKTLCDDLSILLLGSRQGNYISWAMDNKELQDACVEFMKNFETQYEERELNYLKVDYSKFDNLPRPEVDEYCGIEKGYEIFLEEEEPEEPRPPKLKKKIVYDSEGNDSTEFDYLYSSSEYSDDSSNNANKKKKKKRYRQHSSSDSDFKPSYKKSYKDKSKDKKLRMKRKRDMENCDDKKSEYKNTTKPKKIKDLTNTIIKQTPKIKPCIRSNLVMKIPVLKNKITKVVAAPERKISLLRLIRKVKVSNDLNNSESSIPPQRCKLDEKKLKTFNILEPEITSKPDKAVEITSVNHIERDKYLELSVIKNSMKSSNNNVHVKSVQQLLYHSNNSLKSTPSSTSYGVFGRDLPEHGIKSKSFSKGIDLLSKCDFSDDYFTQLDMVNKETSNVVPKPKADPIQPNRISPPIVNKHLDIPGLSGPDMFDWIKPPVVTQTVNVLDVLCHKLSPMKTQKSNTNSAIGNSTTSLDHQTPNQNNISKNLHNIDFLGHQNSEDDVLSMNSVINKTDSNNSTPFNLDIFQSSKGNINLCALTSDKHNNHNHNNNIDSNTEVYNTKTNFYPNEKQQLKKEDKSTDPFVNDPELSHLEDTELSHLDGTELPHLEGREKTIMNLTNFYNDAKNQIDDNSESENSLYELNENSQYESVTVLKTEPIIDSNILDTGNNNLINNLDDAVFIFQNNLDVSDTSLTFTPKETDSEIYSKESCTDTSTLNAIKTDTSQDQIEKPQSTLKLINLKPSPLLQPQTFNSTKFSTIRKTAEYTDKVDSNYCNRNMMSTVSDPIPSNQSKVISSAVNFKYISFPEKSDSNKIVLNSKNVKFPIIHMQLPESSLPTLKINDLKRDKVSNEDKIIDNNNVKYLVKDKNIFKLLYVNAPTTESTNNIQIVNQQQTKQQSKVDKTIEHTPSTSFKKIISNPKSPHVSIPKLLHFDSQRNNNPVDVSKILMKTNDKKNGTHNQKDVSTSPKQGVNIIYQPAKHQAVVGSKNLIVTFPPTKINKSTDTQNKSLPLPTEKNADKKFNMNPGCTHKIVLVPAVSETTPPIPDRSNPISSTTMEQVREFESVLEKVKKTSQLKEKVPHDEVINSSFVTTNQKTTKNVTAVTLGNILLQPTKIATYTNLIYTSDKKLAMVDKPFNVKQTPVIIAKTEDKVVKPPSFPPARSTVPTSNTSGSTSANSTVKPIQKAQEDEQTAEKIYKILNSYTEKIKNAPELKNKPAPRRRSNPPITNSSKCRKNVKCSSKFTYEQSPSVELSDTIDKEPTATTVFPLPVPKVKDSPIKAPVQIQQLTMPLCSAQDNQVVLLTNDKHIILKKIKHVQKLCPSSIVKPMLKAEPIAGNLNTQVVHYKIKNDSLHGLNLINYVSPVNVNNRASIITTMTPCTPTNTSSQSKVSKFAQETQTDISMECSPVVVNNLVETYCEPKPIKQVEVVNVNVSTEEPQNKLEKEHDLSSLCVALDKHYFKNIDVLFFTSFIFLNYPSSQLFMFEATYALSRMIRSNSVSNSISKHYTSRQMNELRTFAESRLPLWEKMKIIDDIILKKKGPHICDTMMIMIKKSDNKKTKENILKNIHEDKIEVNKCNKNPKCYGKKNSINDGSKFKFPHPLEPTVIITNEPEDSKDFDMADDTTNYKKSSKNDRKRPYQALTSVNFDEIEVDNPKIPVPKKKKKYGRRAITCSKKTDVSKKTHPTHGEKPVSNAITVLLQPHKVEGTLVSEAR